MAAGARAALLPLLLPVLCVEGMRTGSPVSAVIDGHAVDPVEVSMRSAVGFELWETLLGHMSHDLAAKVLGELVGFYQLASVGRGPNAVIWSAKSKRPILRLPGSRPYTGVRYLPGAERVATTTSEGVVVVWNATSGERLHELIGASRRWMDAGMDVFPDGLRLVTWSGRPTATIWRADTGQALCELRGISRDVAGAAVFPNGRRVVGWSSDGAATVFDADTCEPECHFFVPVPISEAQALRDLAPFPQGDKVTGVGDDRRVIVWNASSGVILQVLRGHSSVVNGVTVSADGRRVATYSRDSTAIVWNAITGNVMSTLRQHWGDVVRAHFFPGDDRLVTVATDMVAIIWNSTTSRVIHRLVGHSQAVRGVAISPDGDVLATCSCAEVCLWDAASGALLTELTDTAFAAGDGPAWHHRDGCGVDFGPSKVGDPRGFSSPRYRLSTPWFRGVLL